MKVTPPRLSLASVSKERLLEEKIDLCIAASGYEGRATFLAELLGTKSSRRIAFGFEQYRSQPSRVINDTVFASLGYVQSVCPAGSPLPIIDELESTLSSIDKEHLTIVVDYSCMSRPWLWAIMKCLTIAARSRSISVLYSYSPASFTHPTENITGAISAGPVAGLGGGYSLPEENIALIMGLGFEANIAAGLVEAISPADRWIFYTRTSQDDRFPEYVRLANRDLFEVVSVENVVGYDVADVLFTHATLRSVVQSLAETLRVVIVPMGPKVFSMTSMLVALQTPGTELWRVTGTGISTPNVREADGRIVALRVDYLQE